jgi:hypothetical protein
MIEIQGARLVFYGADGQVVASMDVPVKLEALGKVTLVVDAWEVPSAARNAAMYQILLPLPVMYEASEMVMMLASKVMAMHPHPGLPPNSEGTNLGEGEGESGQ